MITRFPKSLETLPGVRRVDTYDAQNARMPPFAAHVVVWGGCPLQVFDHVETRRPLGVSVTVLCRRATLWQQVRAAVLHYPDDVANVVSLLLAAALLLLFPVGPGAEAPSAVNAMSLMVGLGALGGVFTLLGSLQIRLAAKPSRGGR